MTKAPDRTVPVSVILPVHNGGRHLEAAVTSILTQTHQDLELLVIDDGSTDGSGERLDALTDPRVRVLHQPNRGLVAALNRGLDEARHDLVARMDADDVSEPQRLELQAQHLLDHPDVVAVGCCYQVVDEQDRATRVVHTAAAPAYLHRQLYFRNVLPHAGMMFRRAAVMKAGGYRDVGPVEDYDLWTRLAQDSLVASLPAPLLRYRETPTGISRRENDRQASCLREIRDKLHDARPFEPVGTSQVIREGLRHGEKYSRTCPSAMRSYVFDHVWLALILLRRRRAVQALRLLAAVLGILLRRPTAARGLADIVRGR